VNCIRTYVHEHTQLVTGGTVNIPVPLVVFELGAPMVGKIVYMCTCEHFMKSRQKKVYI
jgi:hypothetical protein